MKILEEHLSDDRLLTFKVVEENGDVILGFDEFPWHTHGDILASLSGLPVPEAVRQFVDSILTDNVVLALRRVRGEIADVYPAEDPHEELEDLRKYGVADESISFRYWSGRAFLV